MPVKKKKKKGNFQFFRKQNNTLCRQTKANIDRLNTQTLAEPAV